MTGNKHRVNLLVSAAMNRCAQIDKSACTFSPLQPSTSQDTSHSPKQPDTNEKKRLRSSRSSDRIAPAFLRPLRIVLLILATVGLLGTVVFCTYESSAEHQADVDTYERLNDAIKIIADDLQTTARTEDEKEMEEHVKNAYMKLLEIEGKWPASTKTNNTKTHLTFLLFMLTSFVIFSYLFRRFRLFAKTA